MAALVLAACRPERSTRLPRPQPRPALPLTPPTHLCVTEDPGEPCRPADQVERWLRAPDLEIVAADLPPAGKQGAKVLTLRRPGRPPVVFRAKWRAHATRSASNDPRRELAAHELQKLLLEPHEYVVPPAAGHCFPLAHYRTRVDRSARPTFQGVPCVYGVLSYWLEEVQTLPDAGRAGWFDWEGGALDEDLFEHSPVYRDSVANMNLLTYLIRHADSHWKQFVISKDRRAPAVYSVDNSMSFGARMNPEVIQDWSEIRVPALRRATIDRLRAADLDAIAALAEFVERRGRLVPVEPTAPPAGDAGPVHFDRGRLRVRLSEPELAALRRRVDALLAAVDRGEIEVY